MEAADEGSGLKYGGGYVAPWPWGWNGLIPEGTDNRREEGVLLPLYKDDLDREPGGDCILDGNRGLLAPLENVADVGVLHPVGDCW